MERRTNKSGGGYGAAGTPSLLETLLSLMLGGGFGGFGGGGYDSGYNQGLRRGSTRARIRGLRRRTGVAAARLGAAAAATGWRPAEDWVGRWRHWGGGGGDGGGW